MCLNKKCSELPICPQVMAWPELQRLSGCCISRILGAVVSRIRSQTWTEATTSARVTCTSKRGSKLQSHIILDVRHPWQKHADIFNCSTCQLMFSIYLPD